MSIDTNYTDEVMKLKCEYKTLKDEVHRNNQQIQELQIRDVQSIENMKLFLEKKRQLNNRTKRLKLQILKNFLDQRGGTLKMDDWLTALNISPDFSKTLDECPDLEIYNRNLSEFDVTVKRQTDDFLQELSYKIDSVLNTVAANESGEAKYDDADSDGIHIEKACEMNSESVESIFRFFQQPPTFKSVEKRDSQTSPRIPTPRTDQQVQTTPCIDYTCGELNYPANVELKPISSPPTLPVKRKTATCFTTRYDIRRKRNTSDSLSGKTDKRKTKSKHKEVGDYMLHRNTTSTPLIRTAAESSQSRGKFTSILYTITILATVGALFYAYPTLPNCILLLKDGAEYTYDEFIRTLDSFIAQNIPLSEPRIVEPEIPTTWQVVTNFFESIYQKIVQNFI